MLKFLNMLNLIYQCQELLNNLIRKVIMVSNLNNKLNEFLENEKISKEHFDDLKNVANYTEFDKNILQWFRYLQSFETLGWRNKYVTKKLCNGCYGFMLAQQIKNK